MGAVAGLTPTTHKTLLAQNTSHIHTCPSPGEVLCTLATGLGSGSVFLQLIIAPSLQTSFRMPLPCSHPGSERPVPRGQPQSWVLHPHRPSGALHWPPAPVLPDSPLPVSSLVLFSWTTFCMRDPRNQGFAFFCLFLFTF